MNKIHPSILTKVNENNILATPLHKSATDRVKHYVDGFAERLVLQAKIFASRDKAEIVLERDVDEAVEHIFSRKNHDWLREFLKIIGGTLIGAFVPGLITALPLHDTTNIIIYIALGFLGIITVFIGLFV